MDEINDNKKYLLKGSEVIKLLGFGVTAGYRYLRYLEENKIVKPVYLDGVKTPRWVRSEVMDLANKRTPSNSPEFVTN